MKQTGSIVEENTKSSKENSLCSADKNHNVQAQIAIKCNKSSEVIANSYPDMTSNSEMSLVKRINKDELVRTIKNTFR